jgi:hypothetical protein
MKRGSVRTAAWRVLAMTAALLALLLTTATPASAGVSNYSVWWSYGPVAGVSYQNQSIISTNIVMMAVISVRPTSGSIPGG